jgi:hypothetical protein
LHFTILKEAFTGQLHFFLAGFGLTGMARNTIPLPASTWNIKKARSSKIDLL